MGSTQSLSRRGTGQPFSIIANKAGPGGGKWKEINICLLCQKNSDKSAMNNKSIDGVKNAISHFLRQLYDTDGSTIFNFRTWDQDDADITVTKLLAGVDSANTRSEFDVMVELHCEVACSSAHDGRPPSRDYRLMCRLLHTHGILLVPRDLDSVNAIIRINLDYQSPDATMIPIFSVEVPGKATGSDFSLQAMNGGVTVFQKQLRQVRR